MKLYRRSTFLASAALLAFGLAFTTIHAQRRTPHRLRATALLEVTTDPAGVVSTRVYPVTILDEGSFHDASIYKATPRPMALADGVVYEAQKSGTPVGYVTIVNGSNTGGWVALGKWQPAVEAKKAEPPKPATLGDDRPILHHGESDASSAPAATPTPDEPASQPVPAPPAEDSERPVLRRRTPEKPEQPQPPATPTPTQEGAVPQAKPPAAVAGTKIYVGVSDNQSSDTRSFNFSWKPGEEQQMEVKMRRLALAQLPRENAQLTPGSLQNVVMRSFDLDYSNDAVIVLSAEIPGSYLAQGTASSPGKFVSRYVTVIARVNFEGVPQKLASSVTDFTRLDVAPRLELVDAVDVDGDGLGELLFREYSFDEKSFIVYGVGRTAVTKVFEGASTRLK
jgi:hypothetical protein